MFALSPFSWTLTFIVRFVYFLCARISDTLKYIKLQVNKKGKKILTRLIREKIRDLGAATV